VFGTDAGSGQHQGHSASRGLHRPRREIVVGELDERRAEDVGNPNLFPAIIQLAGILTRNREPHSMAKLEGREVFDRKARTGNMGRGGI
jgi:hypothetical protein